MLKILPIGVAFAILGATCFLHGYHTNRWGKSESLKEAEEKLEHPPLLAGDWDGTLLEVNQDPEKTRGMGAYAHARFVHRSKGDVVDVTLVCGRPGPLALHPPTICFPAHGFKQESPSIRTPLTLKESGMKVEFMAADFSRRTETLPEHIHILWSYGLDGTWSVPDDPRTHWAQHPAVYKLYVFHHSPGATVSEEDPAIRFLRVYLPELQKVLFESRALPSPPI